MTWNHPDRGVMSRAVGPCGPGMLFALQSRMRTKPSAMPTRVRRVCQGWLTVPVALLLASCGGSAEFEGNGAVEGGETAQAGGATIDSEGRLDCSTLRACGDFLCDHGTGCARIGACGDVCPPPEVSVCELQCVDRECSHGDSLPPTLFCSTAARETIGQPQPALETETSLLQLTTLQQAVERANGNKSCSDSTDCELADVGSSFCNVGRRYIVYAPANVTQEFDDALTALQAYYERLLREAGELLECDPGSLNWDNQGGVHAECTLDGQCEIRYSPGG